MEDGEAWTGLESVHVVCELWLWPKVNSSPSIEADFDMICTAPSAAHPVDISIVCCFASSSFHVLSSPHVIAYPWDKVRVIHTLH